MIYAVDFDETLYLKPLPNWELIGWIKERYADGDRFILWTCREGEALEEAKKLMLSWRCLKYFEAFNENLPDQIDDCRKIRADYYIDDRNLEVALCHRKK